MTEEAFLHVDVDEIDLSGVLTQGHKNNYKVVNMVGWELMVTKQCYSIIERLAIAAVWCVKKLNWYTNFLAAGPGLTIIYPHAAEIACLSLLDLPLRLQACILKLSSYGCKFRCGSGACAISGAVSRVAWEEPEADPTPA